MHAFSNHKHSIWSAFPFLAGCPVLLYTLVLDDGKRPSLACATSAGKILVHCPHAQLNVSPGDLRAAAGVSAAQQGVGGGGVDGDIRFLNMNRVTLLNIIHTELDLHTFS